MSSRTFATLLVAAGILLLILWLAPRLPQTKTVEPTAVPTPTIPSPSPTMSPVPVRQRLAGTVVGDVRYAVVEQPDGTSSLYRPGDEVADLGKVLEIEADHATFLTPSGPIVLRLAAAPTGTPGRTRAPRRPTEAPVETPKPAPRSSDAQPESSP